MKISQNGNAGTKKGSNIFADLGFPDADDLQMKAELTRQIRNRIRSLRLTQAQAAKQLGLKQPDVSRLVHGRYTGFSADRLLGLLTALGVDVEVVLRPRSRHSKACGRMSVSSV